MNTIFPNSEMLQKLPTALVQVNTYSNSESLLRNKKWILY